MMTYEQLLKRAKDYIQEQGVPDADIDARYISEYFLNVNHSQFMLHLHEAVDEENIQDFWQMLRKRADRIPLQHILGVTEFMGLPFYVSEKVLCPRQDTETLVEYVLPLCHQKKVLDMCTGSGCIAISIAKLCKNAEVSASDISEDALMVAKKNVEANQVDIQVIKSDLFVDIHHKYDMIVSNPPYIRTKDIEELMPEVRDHEPRIALDGSKDGLHFYRNIIKESPQYLTKKGMLIVEVGYDQAEDVRALMEQYEFKEVEVIRDLAGHDRVVKGQLGMEI